MRTLPSTGPCSKEVKNWGTKCKQGLGYSKHSK
jgi:hypothetical protein